MNKTALYYLRAFLALAALLGFMYLYGRAIIEAFTLRANPPVYNNAYVYVATSLAGLVGGVAATSLGQALPGRGLMRRFSFLGKVVAPFQAENLQNTLGIGYTLVYTIFGIAAIAAWVTSPEPSKLVEMVTNLGLIFIGLVLATAQNFFGIAPSNDGRPVEVPPTAAAGRGPGKSSARATPKPASKPAAKARPKR